MKGDDDSSSESDIDDILNALEKDLKPDQSITASSSTSSQNQPSKSNLRSPLKVNSKPLENTTAIPSGINQSSRQQSHAKSVRFSQELPQSPTTTSMSNAKAGSGSSLFSLFFPNDEGSSGTEDTKFVKNLPQEKPKHTNIPTDTASQPQKNSKPLALSGKDDWLGLGDETMNSLQKSSAPTLSSSPAASTIKAFDAFLQREASEEAFEPVLDSRTSAGDDKTAKQPYEFPSSNIRKPPNPLNSSNLRTLSASSPSAEFQLGKTSGKSSGPDMNQNQENDGGSAVSSLTMLPVTSRVQQNQYPLQPSSIEDRSQGNPQTPSFLDALPFLKQKVQGNIGISRESLTPGAEGIGEGIQHPKQPVGTGPAKKKVTVSKIGASQVAANTLQLPSHLVNEEELKTMSSSLKTLYANQLEMLENSYKEQLEFVASSNRRREDLLKEEMSSLQSDYEQRLQRLRTELAENNTKFPDKIQHEISDLSSHIDKLSSQFESLKDHKLHGMGSNSETNSEEFKNILLTELEKLMGTQISNVVQRIEASLLGGMKHSLEDSVFQSSSAQAKAFEEITSRLDIISSAKENDSFKIVTKFEEIEKSRKIDTEKILKTQKKLKDNAVNSAVDFVSKILENEHEENRRRKDRLAIQIKEFRKDLRRLYVELENKNETVHKSQLSMEMEQRNITQAIRDINTIIKLTSKLGFNANNDSTNAAANQLAAMQAFQHQTQNEMEIKLLRDERNALSESIAQMNVERRKLTDEKLHFEREKIEFEREKSRVREIEMQAKAKSVEAEEMKRHADLVRQQEAKLTGEVDLKLQEMKIERSRMKEKLFEIEQKLIMREQKLFHEKTELIREKEFIDKLRDQLLCPGCLNSVKGVSTLHNLAPPPYPIFQTRSAGDGIELNNSISNFNHDMSSIINLPKINLTPEEDSYFRKESKYLDELTSKYYSNL